MKPAKKIKPQDWMLARETRRVMKALDADGGADGGKARFVGGCVRNALLGEEVGDIDIATKFAPAAVTARLEAAGVKVIPTGIEHGTVTAVHNKKHFEVTTLRRDVSTDGRRATVAFTDDWAEDAGRRDFTINTLLADEAGNVYDPTERGLADLKARKIIFVGDPAKRIAEDYLRILRFFRFHATYGKGAPDVKGLKACREAADKIPGLSRERITQEFFKILSVGNPVDILSVMFENSVLKEFHFKEYDENLLRHLCYFQNNYLMPSSRRKPGSISMSSQKAGQSLKTEGPMDPGFRRDDGSGLSFISARLFTLAALDKDNVLKMEKLLLIPKVFKKDIEALSQVLGMPALDNEQAVKTAVYKGGRVAAAQGLMIELAQDRVMNGWAPKALKIIQKWDVPNFPVTGADLKKAGIEEGPDMGKILRDMEESWIAGGFKGDKKAVLAKI